MNVKQETLEHIWTVQVFINSIMENLALRARAHDASKLESPEVEAFEEWKPKLRQAEAEHGYYSKEYQDCLTGMGPALQHHFKSNDHHPEYYDSGINGMSLLSLMEMLADWKAASMQSGQPLELEKNRERFKISDQLFEIIKNTAKEMGW